MNAVCQLDREWQVLAPGVVGSALAGWRGQEAALGRFHSPQQLLRFLHSEPPAGTDGPLLALLCLAADDRLAGRLLLQAILPALKSQAERIAHDQHRRDEVWELLLFFAWEAICSYPTQTRRARVAANLVLQVLHDTTRELQRAAASDEQPRLGFPDRDADGPAGQPAPTDRDSGRRLEASGLPDVEALLVSAVAGGAIAELDAQLILQTRVDGIGLRLLARSVGVGYDALRKRRQRAEQQLRTLILASQDVPKSADRDLTSTGGTIAAARLRVVGAAREAGLQLSVISRDAA